MNKTIVYVVAVVVVSLIAGVLLGLVLFHRQGVGEYGRIPGRFGHEQALRRNGGPLEKLSKILNLSAEQKVKLAQILKDSRQEVMQIQDKTKEMFLEIKNKANVKIREILTAEQQAKFDKLKSDLQQKMKGKRARPRFLNRDQDGNRPMLQGAPGEDLPQPGV